jgi:hypothetical protein
MMIDAIVLDDVIGKSRRVNKSGGKRGADWRLERKRMKEEEEEEE